VGGVQDGAQCVVLIAASSPPVNDRNCPANVVTYLQLTDIVWPNAERLFNQINRVLDARNIKNCILVAKSNIGVKNINEIKKLTGGIAKK
jgi:hypothetical protein